MRSHPPTLITLVRRALREDGLIPRGSTVLIGCSGGADSTALLHVLGRLRGSLGFELVAAGIDHGLRAEAPDELALGAKVAGDLGVRFVVRKVHVAGGSNLQARARKQRLLALAELAEEHGAGLVATGHTADDRAETVLMRLLRGAGPKGLGALPPRSPWPDPSVQKALIRPILRARRSDVLAHLVRHELPFASDPSNFDPKFLRVRVRRELLPLLEGLSPQIVSHLTNLADMLAQLPEDAGAADLGRAQRFSLARAARQGRRSLTIRLTGGADVEVPVADP